MTGFRFNEVMEGTLRREGEAIDRSFRFRFDVRAPSLSRFLTSGVTAPAAGTVDIEGIATSAAAEGSLEMSPFGSRTLRYVFDFEGDDGEPYHFDGTKTIRWLEPRTSWTTLPGEVRDATGRLVGGAVLRFSFQRHLSGLVRSFRLEGDRAVRVGG